MSLFVSVFDRVKCTTTSTGAGNLVMDPVAGFNTPDALVADGSGGVSYCITDDSNNWEIGCATMSGATLVRSGAPFSSSNAGAYVDWGPGSKTVVFGLQASQVVVCGRDEASGTWTQAMAANGGIAGGNAAFSNGGVALGHSAYANAGCLGIGKDAESDGDSSVALGQNTHSGNGGIAVGFNASSYDSLSTASRNVAIGEGAIASKGDSIAIGKTALSDGADSVAVGKAASAAGTNSIAIGKGAAAQSANSVAIGRAQASTQNTLFFAAEQYPVALGETQGAALTLTLSAKTLATQNVWDVVFPYINLPVCASIDIIGCTTDGNGYTVGIRGSCLWGPTGVVGTPSGTLLGRSSSLAASVTAGIVTGGNAIKVRLTGSTAYDMNWAIVARMSNLNHVI